MKLTFIFYVNNFISLLCVQRWMWAAWNNIDLWSWVDVPLCWSFDHFLNRRSTIAFHYVVCFHFVGNVSAGESKFHWPKKVDDVKYPLFGDPQNFDYVDNNQKPREADIRNVCGTSQSCRRDYYATNDVNVARASKATETKFAALQSSQKLGK